MAAPTVTQHLIDDGYHTARMLCTAVFDDADETAVGKLNVDELKYSDPHADAQTVTVESIKWNISGSGVVSIQLDGDAPISVAELTAHGEMAGGCLSDAGGDVLFTTTGMNPGDTYQVEFMVRKADGFTLDAYAVEASVDLAGNEESPVTDFVTDDVIAVAVEFSEPVFVKGVPKLQLVLDASEETPEVFRYADCQNENNASHETLTFHYTVTEEDVAEAADFAIGEIVLDGSASITGGFASAPARLSGFDSDASSVTVNEPEEEPEPEP